MAPMLLADARFLIQDARNVLRDKSVLIEDGRVVAIDDRDNLPKSGAGQPEINCSGLLLMPGLVNAHTHLFQVLTRGIGKSWRVRQWAERVTYPVARRLSDEEFYSAALLACADSIRNGCTAVVDHPTHYARFHADQSCRAIMASGMRGAVARGGADKSLVDSGEVRALSQDLEDVGRFIERWRDEELVQPWVGPSGFHTCSTAALREYKNIARALRTRFHMHLAESAEGKREAVEAGFLGEASQAYSLGLLDDATSVAHGVWLDPEELDVLSRSQCQIVHCPTSNQILGSGIAPVPRMREKGIPIALASDGASSNDSLDMFAEMKSAALIHRAINRDATVIGAGEVFEAATQGGARVLGLENVGRLAVGYAADIIGLQLDGNPSLTPCVDPVAAVVFYSSGRDVVLNMVNGRILFWRGSYRTLDIDDAIGRVNDIVRRHEILTR